MLAYLLTIHETVYQIEQTQQEVIPTYVKPGVSALVTELLSLLNQDKFQATLLTLADMYLGQSRHNKKGIWHIQSAAMPVNPQWRY